MSYFAPYVDATGFHIPTYADILADDVAQFLTIYPANSYQGIDATDYQYLSIRALKTFDAFQAAQLAYNQRSPATAIGSGLDTVVKYAGIARKLATYSTATLTLGGTLGATVVLTNAIVTDKNGNQWLLPASATIPPTGTVNVTATAGEAGPVVAAAGTIIIISTPTGGWLSATNAADASPGQPIETDSQLRGRFYRSVALPSRSLLDGTIAAIAAIPGVTRYNVLENFTGAVDAFGNPPHSVSAVVEGGDEDAIGQAIYANKGIGAYTNGTTAITIIDPGNANLAATTRFFRPTDVPIYVAITIHGLNQSFNTATQVAVQTSIADYLNSLQIGESLTVSALYAAALSVMPNLSLPQFSIHALSAGRSAQTESGNDIPVLFNEVVTGSVANIAVTVV